MNIKNWFKKWKLYDSSKYDIIPKYIKYNFRLSPTQIKQVEKLYSKYGNMDYIFYYTGIGIGFKVKIWKTNEYIDLTDYDTW